MHSQDDDGLRMLDLSRIMPSDDLRASLNPSEQSGAAFLIAEVSTERDELRTKVAQMHINHLNQTLGKCRLCNKDLCLLLLQSTTSTLRRSEKHSHLKTCASANSFRSLRSTRSPC